MSTSDLETRGVRTGLKKTGLKTRGTRLLLRAGLLTLLALGATFLLDPYRNYQLATSAGVFAAVAGLTLLVGLTGQLSLGHAVLMAAGGYGYALTATWVAGALAGAGGEVADGVVGWLLPLLAGVAGALVASGALGLLLGLAAARLRGPYLAGSRMDVAKTLVTDVAPWLTRRVRDLGPWAAHETIRRTRNLLKEG